MLTPLGCLDGRAAASELPERVPQPAHGTFFQFSEHSVTGQAKYWIVLLTTGVITLTINYRKLNMTLLSK